MMELLGLPAWQVFAIVGVVLAISEIAVPGFILLPIGLGFLVGAILSVFTSSAPLTWIFLFISLSGVYFGFSKWAKKSYVPNLKTGIEGLIGQKASVVTAIQPNSEGQIKISADRFAALSVDNSPIAAGQPVEIIRFEGNKAIVRKIQ